MLDLCDFSLASSFGYDCANPVKTGARNKAYIYNYDDIDFSQTTISGGKVTSFKLKTGKKGYYIYVAGNTPYTGTKTDLASGTYRNDFTKTFACVILNNGAQVASNVIKKLANGLFVVVIENKFGGTSNDNAFEIYGLENGLRSTTGSSDKYSDDAEGGWTWEMTEENAQEAGVYLTGDSREAIRATLEASLTNSVLQPAE